MTFPSCNVNEEVIDLYLLDLSGSCDSYTSLYLIMRIEELPNELLSLVLEWLARADLRTLLRCRQASKRFRLLVADCLFGPTKEKIVRSNGQVQPLLMAHFQFLFRSGDCFTPTERAEMFYLTLEGDCTRPFKRLPWAQDPKKRQAFLRPRASWRDLGVSFGCGMPVTQLEIVKTYSSEEFNEEGRDHVQYMQVDLEVSSTTGHLTMGLLYDLLLCHGAVGCADAITFGTQETGSWELFLGKRLRSADTLFEYECFIASDEVLVDSSIAAGSSAILFVQGGSTDASDDDRGGNDGYVDEWEPTLLGPRPSLLPWQGPKNRIIQDDN